MSNLRTEDDVKKIIEEFGYENVLIFSNPSYASAFVGISEDNRAIYDFDKMIEYLIEEEGWSDIEAIEFIEQNCLRSLPYYENAPIVMYRLEDY
jgi:hypothetical protein